MPHHAAENATFGKGESVGRKTLTQAQAYMGADRRRRTKPVSLVSRGDALLVAAYEVLGESGLDGLTVRAVLTRAGVNRRTFYDRFSGKDDLLLALFRLSLQAVADNCRAHIATIPDPVERLRYVVTYIVTSAGKDEDDAVRSNRRGAALCREHIRLADTRPTELRVALEPVIALLADQLAQAIEAGQVRNRPPERLAMLVYNLVSTTMHAEILKQAPESPFAPEDREQLAQEIWEFCANGLAPQS